MKKTIAVDFDGVIHRYSKGWHDGTIYDKPMPGSQEGLVSLKEIFSVYIHTTRNVAEVMEWMNTTFWDGGDRVFITIAMPEGTRFWNGEEVAVSNRKLPAQFYLDDRAITFVSWKETLYEIDVKRTWEEEHE